MLLSDYLKVLKAVNKYLSACGYSEPSMLDMGTFQMSGNFNNLPAQKEMIGVYYASGSWHFCNVDRKESYPLERKASKPLPTRINEGALLDLLDELYKVYKGKYGLNLIIVKLPNKLNYQVVSLKITNDVWAF